MTDLSTPANLGTADTDTSAQTAEGRALFGIDGFSLKRNVVACFTPGTAIATARGERLVEELGIGDRIVTRDNGIQPLRWIGSKRLTALDLARNPHLSPVLLRRGSLGDNLPERHIWVSPNHRMLVNSAQTALHFHEEEVLAAAKHMIGAQGIESMRVQAVTYIHLLFDRHEVILSNGCWSESFQPDAQRLQGFGHAQRTEILELFPDLRTDQRQIAYQPTRHILTRDEALRVAR